MIKIDFSKLKKHEYKRLRNPPATIIYFLLFDEEVVYVGATGNLSNRVENHYKGSGATGKKKFNNVFYMDNIGTTEILRVEACLIRALSPKYNLQKGGNYAIKKLPESIVIQTISKYIPNEKS